MSFGKMNTFISIVEKQFIQDEDGFKAETDATVAEVRAYREGPAVSGGQISPLSPKPPICSDSESFQVWK